MEVGETQAEEDEAERRLQGQPLENSEVARDETDAIQALNVVSSVFEMETGLHRRPIFSRRMAGVNSRALW
jgi:hypothetical protein